MKICTKCKQTKEEKDFYKRKDGSTASHCKLCFKLKMRENRKNWTPEQKLKDKIRLNKYIKENKEHVKNKHKEYWDRNKDKSKNNALYRKYGISLSDYQKMFAEQLGVCAICYQAEVATINNIRKTLSVDHNHTTGKIRGLLCYRCNSALGLLKEDEKLIMSTLFYIKKYL